MLGRFYQWFWFHTEFWLTRVDRRPYTFIMRDWIYTHSGFAAAMVFSWFTGVMALSIWYGTLSTGLSIFSGLLTAHLVWGSQWIEHQQEYPEYVE